MAGSKKGTNKVNNASATTNKSSKKKENTTKEEKKMDETADNTIIKDSSGDVIMGTTDDKIEATSTASNKNEEETKSDSNAIEYDSDGNNLYGEDDHVSVSDKTTAASNESPDKGKKTKRQKATSKRLAPIFEKNKKVPVCKTKFLYVAGIPVKKTKKAMEEYHRAIKDFLKEINDYDSTAILYEMYAASTPKTFEIKNWAEFPGKPSLVKQYLANCNPYAGDGTIWATFQLGLNECDESFIWIMKEVWARSNGGFFKKKELQHMDTKQEIWFCLSHDDMDIESLCTAQKNQYKFDTNESLELSLKFTTIKDGNSGFYKQRNREQDDSLGTRRYVKGIVAETTTEQFDAYYDWVMKTYSRSSNRFPQGIRLRAVPIISKEYDIDTQDKIKILMQRQEHFQDSVTSTFYLHVQNIDTVFKETGKTLREHLMNIPISETNQNPLFISIGIKHYGKRKGDLLFTYPKKYATKASRIVSNLNSYCFKTLGEPVLHQFFTPRATKQAKETKWDAEAGRAVSKTEQNLQSIMDEFDELDYIEAPEQSKPNTQTTIDQHAAPPVAQVDAQTQDDISSFGNSLLGGNKQAAPRQSAFATTFNPPDDHSVAKSVAETVQSLESRMSAIEDKLQALDRLTAFLDKMENGNTSQNGSTVTPPVPPGTATTTDNVVGTSTETKSSEAPAH